MFHKQLPISNFDWIDVFVLDDIRRLRSRLGNALWLDSLTDEQFAIIRDEIIPVYEKAAKYRLGV